MKKYIILLLIPILILSGCATVSPVSTNNNHVIEEKGLDDSDQQEEYVENRVDRNIHWLALSGVGAVLFAVGSLMFMLSGFSYTQEQYDEATSQAMPFMIGGAVLGVVSLTLFFTM